MNEEEKKAIEVLKSKRASEQLMISGKMCVDILLNLIEKQQKELNSLKEIEQAHKTDNGLLRQELDMQIEHNKELEEKLKITVAIITKGMYPEQNEGDNDFDKQFISKDKIKEIVDEHIPKQPNIITGEIEYTPNANANSFLVQDILKLLEEK